jgi:gas vesicle structural protein
VKRPRTTPPGPPKGPKLSTVSVRHRHSTVPRNPPEKGPQHPRPRRRDPEPKLSQRAPKRAAPKRQVGRIIDEDEASLLDLIDNLLSKGVMLNAELILALANVDLVYVRLSALLCAADRVLPRLRPDPVSQAHAKN